jgi:hypothetical protein
MALCGGKNKRALENRDSRTPKPPQRRAARRPPLGSEAGWGRGGARPPPSPHTASAPPGMASAGPAHVPEAPRPAALSEAAVRQAKGGQARARSRHRPGPHARLLLATACPPARPRSPPLLSADRCGPHPNLAADLGANLHGSAAGGGVSTARHFVYLEPTTGSHHAAPPPPLLPPPPLSRPLRPRQRALRDSAPSSSARKPEVRMRMCLRMRAVSHAYSPPPTPLAEPGLGRPLLAEWRTLAVRGMA